jgi:predicted nucleic acid-binding protein
MTMTGVDTHILIDLAVRSMPLHQASSEKVQAVEDELCTTPTNIGECLRLMTHPRVFPRPLALGKAVSVLGSLLGHYRIRILEEPVDWWSGLGEIEKDIPGIRGNEVFDARVALCLRHHGVRKLLTRDADFRKYGFLKVV